MSAPDFETDEDYRVTLYKRCQGTWGLLPVWKEIGTELHFQVTNNLPLTINNDNFTAVEQQITSIETYLAEKGIPLTEFDFFREHYNLATETVSVQDHTTPKMRVENKETQAIAQVSKNKVGVVNLPTKHTYEQAKFLSQQIYAKTKELKFFVTKEYLLTGNITLALRESAAHVNLLQLVAKKGRKDEPDTIRSVFIGEVLERGEKVVESLNAQMYLYRFYAVGGAPWQLLSTKELDLASYNVMGMKVEINDTIELGETAKVKSHIPLLIVYDAVPHKVKFNNNKELEAFMQQKDIRPEMFDWLFTKKISTREGGIDRERNVAIGNSHPKIYCQLLWAHALHANKLFGNEYPLHLFIIGDRGQGKSLMMDAMSDKFGEADPPYAGGSSTLKGLIPSFGESLPKSGYLAQCNRYAFVDEFFQMFTGTGGAGRWENASPSLGKMNELLEHQLRSTQSGKGNVRTRMRARALIMTNPPGGIEPTIVRMLEVMNVAFMSRFLIYWIESGSVHDQSVRNVRLQEIPEFTYDFNRNDFLSIVDYMRSVPSEFDTRRIDACLNVWKQWLNPVLLSHYQSRHIHHAYAVMDGVIKTRCLLARSADFTAVEEDYADFEDIWRFVISGWIGSFNPATVPLEKRHRFLPDMPRAVWDWIVEQKKPVEDAEIKYFFNAHPSFGPSGRVVEAVMILRNFGLIKDYGRASLVPHWWASDGSEVVE